jgi:tetratricopeptide (TPR) repeat protein/tRNA A-37 threonylcarbamoyl transferase component Bud32
MPDDIPNGWQPNSRFEAVLVEIQQAEEQGRTIEQREYLDRFPDLAEPLREYFQDREWFAPVAAVLAPTPTPPGMPPQPEPPPVSHFGDYAILQQLDQGGQSIIYRVSDPELHRSLAVKVLRPELRDQPDAVRRLLKEAQVTGQLQHPGIVPVHAVDRLPDGRPYFVMKLIDGCTLAQLLAVRPAPTHDLPHFLVIFQQVCQAVASAHSRGVIHRDLKPKNIMVGAFAEVQVMDWGFAKVLASGGCQPPGTGKDVAPGGPDTLRTVRTEETGLSSVDGLVMGTLAYMAPEQAKGLVEELDQRADVFGLGAILCEVLTGLPPYTGHSARELQAKAAAGDLAEALARLDGCGADAELIALARDCLAPQRERRPRDAAAVAERLTVYLTEVQERLRRAEVEKAAAQAKAEEAKATVRAERRARRLSVGLAIAVLAVLVSLAIGGLWLQWQQAEEARQAEALRRDVGAMLAQAIRFRQSAHFKEGRELLEQAQQRLGTEGPADLRKQVDQVLADTELARRLDAARQRLIDIREGKLDLARAAQEYALAFKEAGLGEEGEDAGVVAARVRASAVRAEVVAALDDWAAIAGDGPRRAWLLAVARAADPDPQRDRLRQPELWRDGAALARLAEEARVAELSPQLALALAQALSMGGADPIPLLRKAQAQHPDDFWLNVWLGAVLRQAKQWDEAIGYDRAALALRPEAPIHTNLGLSLYDKGRLGEALAHYEKALRINPRYAQAHTCLGLVFYRKGKLNEAIRHYEQALLLDSNDALTHNNLGAALRDKGRLDEALAHHKEAVRLEPKYAKARHNLGATLCSMGRLDEAIAHLEEALRLDPKDAQAHSNFGEVLRAKGWLDEAISHGEQAVHLDPKDAKAHFNLGKALYDKSRLDEAISQCKEALRLDPKFAKAHTNLGAALYDQGQWGQAVRHFEEALRLDPKDAVAHYNLGLALYDKRRLDKAIGHYEEAIRIKPDYANAHINLGAALYDKGRLDEAITHYKKAVRLCPKDARARINLGAALRDKGRLDEAITHYEEALRLNKEDPVAHNNLSVALRAKGRLDEAITHLKEAVRIKPDYANAHINLGAALYDKGRLDEAITHYKEAVRLRPKDAKARHNLGVALYDKGRLDEAITHYEEALRLNKEDPVAHYNFGSALHAKGRLDEAITHLKEAVRLGPKDLWAHNNLGRALHAKGRLDEAILHLKEAVRLGPKNALPHYNLGRALRDKGRVEEAVGQYEEALRLDPKYAYGHSALGEALLVLGRFAKAREATRRCLDLLPPQDSMRAAVTQQLQRCEEALRKRAGETKSK